MCNQGAKQMTTSIQLNPPLYHVVSAEGVTKGYLLATFSVGDQQTAITDKINASLSACQSMALDYVIDVPENAPEKQCTLVKLIKLYDREMRIEKATEIGEEIFKKANVSEKQGINPLLFQYAKDHEIPVQGLISNSLNDKIESLLPKLVEQITKTEEAVRVIKKLFFCWKKGDDGGLRKAMNVNKTKPPVSDFKSLNLEIAGKIMKIFSEATEPVFFGVDYTRLVDGAQAYEKGVASLLEFHGWKLERT